MTDCSGNTDALRRRFEETLRNVLDKTEEFHIENAPDGSDGFMQCTPSKEPDSLYLEYSEYSNDGERSIFRTPSVPFETAVELFTSYASGQADWKTRVEWGDWTEEFNEGGGLLGYFKTIGAVVVVVILVGGFIWGFAEDWRDGLESLGINLLWILAIGLFFLISYVCSRFSKNKFFWPNK